MPTDTPSHYELVTEDEKQSRVHSKGGRIPQESSELLRTLLSFASSQLFNRLYEVFTRACQEPSCDLIKEISIQKTRWTPTKLIIPIIRSQSLSRSLEHFSQKHNLNQYLSVVNGKKGSVWMSQAVSKVERYFPD